MASISQRFAYFCLLSIGIKGVRRPARLPNGTSTHPRPAAFLIKPAPPWAVLSCVTSVPVTTHWYGTCWLSSSLKISSLDSWLPKTGLTSTFPTIAVRESEQILSMKLMNEWTNESEIKMEKAWQQTAATLPVPILQRISWGFHLVWYMLISIFFYLFSEQPGEEAKQHFRTSRISSCSASDKHSFSSRCGKEK